MKIGIVTQLLHNNYGGTLQAYALQEVLRRMGHQPVTIDYLPDCVSKIRYVAAQVKTAVNYLLFRTNRKFYAYPQIKRSPQFAEFMQKHIIVTNRVKSYKKAIIRKYKMEALIVGSDQVWRGSFYSPDSLPDMYLRFAKDLQFPKIAYAASFGIEKWDYSAELTKACSYYAKFLTAISTREDSGVRLCKDYLGVNAVGVSDPTLLLDKNDYNKLCSDVPVCKESFLLAYLLDITPELKEKIVRLALDLNVSVKFVTSEVNIEFSVEEWLALYRDASFVVTNSFHGTVFSILYNKDFYSIVHDDRGAERFNSLLNRFHLLNRLLKFTDDFPLDSAINWLEVNKLREIWREKSLNFLSTSILKQDVY